MSPAPFVFRLERVRELRRRDERRAQQDLGAGLAVQRDHEQALAEAAARRQAASAHQLGVVASAPSGGDLAALQAWRERTERDERTAELAVERHRTEVTALRDGVRDASVKRQVLDRLRERRAGEHARAVAHAEGEMLDEIALSRHRVALAGA